MDFSLGSTRFMKVARVEHAEGPYVLKVFLLQDPSFCIEPYRDQVSVSIARPFKKVAAFQMGSYIKYGKFFVKIV